MAKLATTKELRSMQINDLLHEIVELELAVGKLRLGVKLRKEKDTGKYRREKRHLARMKTVLTEKRSEQLPTAKPVSTVPTPRKK